MGKKYLILSDLILSSVFPPFYDLIKTLFLILLVAYNDTMNLSAGVQLQILVAKCTSR